MVNEDGVLTGKVGWGTAEMDPLVWSSRGRVDVQTKGGEAILGWVGSGDAGNGDV